MEVCEVSSPAQQWILGIGDSGAKAKAVTCKTLATIESRRPEIYNVSGNYAELLEAGERSVSMATGPAIESPASKCLWLKMTKKKTMKETSDQLYWMS
ncbi:hypothetical protein DNTS_035794 [Danionella cerebrum]|uniref:Uncharacterized protein n=1 Tax=Danionella cerebrum TaxID=2873325 RepID=A0A553Q5T5_9TELE|nr:hypothetical protein DNTS_035794 [Danionella translucida]